MREPAFLRRNKEKWLEYEQSLSGNANSDLDPDELAELYIQLTDDLAYARTFYPRSKIVNYLNGLAARTHLQIYRSRSDKGRRILEFWTRELPLIYFFRGRYLIYASAIFFLFFLVGAFSTWSDPAFVSDILGEEYVSMTLNNIAEGNPTAVYEDESPFTMFLMIAINNVRVSFYTFAMGIVGGLGTVWLLMKNGVMLGAFLFMFLNEGVAARAWPVIYVHGTLEITALVFAGGAGLLLGAGVLFPDTRSRIESLKIAAKDGVKIIVGLVPVFIAAALLESYVTGYIGADSMAMSFVVVVLSMVFILGYYLWLPIHRGRQWQSGEASRIAALDRRPGELRYVSIEEDKEG